jgi:hypothetical protein
VGLGGPPGNGPGLNGHVGAPGNNGYPPAGSGQRPLPFPTVLPGIGQAGGDVALPPADRPVPAPILPTVDPRPQPSPIPLPRVTQSPRTDPGNQSVVLPRAQSAGNESQSPFDLVEAQVIGLFLAVAAALAALLRPARVRAARLQDQKGQHSEQLAGATEAPERPRRHRLLPWPWARKQ